MKDIAYKAPQIIKGDKTALYFPQEVLLYKDGEWGRNPEEGVYNIY